jgi:hypothetical protein
LFFVELAWAGVLADGHNPNVPGPFYFAVISFAGRPSQRMASAKILSQFLTPNERKHMKPVIRYQSQLLFRRSYKPKRLIRIRPIRKLNVVFVPSHRFGAKPKITIVP